MAYESSAEPIKLVDFRLPEGYPKEMGDDLTRSFEPVFEEGLAQGMIDTPVETVFREVEGLPKGPAARPRRLDPDGTRAHLVDRFAQE